MTKAEVKKVVKTWAPRTVLMVAIMALGFQIGVGCAAIQKALPVIKALCPKCGDVLDLLVDTSGHGHSMAPDKAPVAETPAAP